MDNGLLANKMKKIALTASDFEKIFNEKLSDYVKSKVEEYKFSCYDVTPDERDACIKKIISALLDSNLVCAGEHRIENWEKGWSENLKKIASNPDFESIIPKYFGKHNIVRLNQKFIKPASKNFEYNMLCIILDWIFDKYMRDASSIYEFGCGTGHHLVRTREVNPTANLWGLDWTESSQKIIQNFALKMNDSKLFAHKFDFLNPNREFVIERDAVVYTVASLEQIGTKFDKFIAYLRSNKPKLCIHVEPIAELLDENNLLDYLSIVYFKKRNYLSGFLPYLRNLESIGDIKILKAQRTFIGSLFIEGYSVIVWSP
jgi:hypothetical protein